MGTATITLSSGQQVIINYSWSFGEMAIVAALLVIILLYGMRWLYDVLLLIWAARGSHGGD